MIEAVLLEASKETVVKTLNEVSELGVKNIPLETMDIVEDGSLVAIEVENQLLEETFKSIEDMNTQVLVDMGALYGPLVIIRDEWWRVFTSMFLHGGMTHILMNMFSLYLIGRGMEAYFQKRAYITIYILSGLLGSLASLYMHPQPF